MRCDRGVDPLRVPEPFLILNPSNFLPKNGFPVVKGGKVYLLLPEMVSLNEGRSLTPLQLKTLFFSTNLLEVSIGRGIVGALKGLLAQSCRNLFFVVFFFCAILVVHLVGYGVVYRARALFFPKSVFFVNAFTTGNPFFYSFS